MYALRLLEHHDVWAFLTTIFFPVEERVMRWLQHDCDVRRLLDRRRAIRRDSDGNVLYQSAFGVACDSTACDSADILQGERAAASYSADMLQGERAAPQPFQLFEGRCVSRVETACPSNSLWARCFSDFLDLAHEIFFLLKYLGDSAAVNADGDPARAFCSGIVQKFETLRLHFARALPLHDGSRLYALGRAGRLPFATWMRLPFATWMRRDASETEFSPIFAAAPVPFACEAAMRDFKINADCSSGASLASTSFEEFLQVAVPAVFRSLRARIVFMHAWFPFSDVLRAAVYTPADQELPRPICVLEAGVAGWDEAARLVDSGRMALSLHGAIVSRENRSEEAYLRALSCMLGQQFGYFEACEFGCVLDPGNILRAVHLPPWRTTANAIVEVAKAMCVMANYRKLQRRLAFDARGSEDERKAVREAAENLFCAFGENEEHYKYSEFQDDGTDRLEEKDIGSDRLGEKDDGADRLGEKDDGANALFRARAAARETARANAGMSARSAGRAKHAARLTADALSRCACSRSQFAAALAGANSFQAAVDVARRFVYAGRMHAVRRTEAAGAAAASSASSVAVDSNS